MILKNMRTSVLLSLSMLCASGFTLAFGLPNFKAAGALHAQKTLTGLSAAAAKRGKLYKAPKKPWVKPLYNPPVFGYNPVDEVIKLNEQRIESTSYGTYMLENIRGKDAEGNFCRLYPTQDRVFVGGLLGKKVFAVCDGHGTLGDVIADQVIKKVLISAVNSKKIVDGILDACKKMQDTLVKEPKAFRAGTTFLAAFIDNALLTVAHVGDSRLAVVRPSENKLIFATQDHKAIFYTGLAISRAFGDIEIFQRGHTTAAPEISQLPLQEGDYLVLASDGYWDMLNNKQTTDLIVAGSKARKTCKQMAQELAQLARTRKSRDDISVVVVRFSQNSENERVRNCN